MSRLNILSKKNILIAIAILIILGCFAVGYKLRTQIRLAYKQWRTEEVELYKYDTLDINSFYAYDSNCRLYFDSKVFTVVGNKLFLSNPDSTTQRTHQIQIIDGDALVTNQLVKIRDWKTDLYALQQKDTESVIPLLVKQDTMFFAQNGKLKYEVNNTVVDCGEFDFPAPIYNEFVAHNGLYALRIQSSIYVSDNLKQWDKIYDDKRTINKSMAIVSDSTNHNPELIFSEYTPGAERFRHHIYKYNFNTKQTRTVMTFYKTDENKTPFARHIHILEQDPYTGDIWVGTGDTDEESAIYRSTDNGETFHVIGSGSQKWRVLAFIFTPNHIFWNVDSYEPQYLTRVDRNEIQTTPVNEKQLKQFSVINGACWGVIKTSTADGQDIWIMSSNNEGGIFDNYCRTYGITIDQNGVPQVAEITKLKARTLYTQLFPVGVNRDGSFVLVDHETGKFYNFNFKSQ